jgi:hypothetical protein
MLFGKENYFDILGLVWSYSARNGKPLSTSNNTTRSFFIQEGWERSRFNQAPYQTPLPLITVSEEFSKGDISPEVILPFSYISHNI